VGRSQIMLQRGKRKDGRHEKIWTLEQGCQIFFWCVRPTPEKIEPNQHKMY
jgi:sarcosine oxidase delta subunit